MTECRPSEIPRLIAGRSRASRLALAPPLPPTNVSATKLRGVGHLEPSVHSVAGQGDRHKLKRLGG